MVEKIQASIKKFNLNLEKKIVLTEAASGNYVVTSVIAALAGAIVYAVVRESRYASIIEVKKQTYNLATKFGVEDKITIFDDKQEIDFKSIDIITNTGFVRPINEDMIQKLSTKCVIALMWEPWEYREEDLNIEACARRGIKVYGTNERDKKLRTMHYLGYIVLNFLLNEKKSPFSANILLLGNRYFCEPIIQILKQNNYKYTYVSEYKNKINIENFDSIVIAEHEKDTLLIGKDALISNQQLETKKTIIHICGNVDFSDVKYKTIPKNPADFGYMSFTTDYIDSQAVIDLHTAGLKVAEGMLNANEKGFDKVTYKNFIEKNYYGKAFDEKRYW